MTTFGITWCNRQCTRLSRSVSGETAGLQLPRDLRYRNRFPAQIIGHDVWLYDALSVGPGMSSYFRRTWR